MDHLSLPADLDFILSPNSADLSIGGLLSGSRDNIVNIWSLESIDDQVGIAILFDGCVICVDAWRFCCF